jgi:hypothetical protein
MSPAPSNSRTVLCNPFLGNGAANVYPQQCETFSWVPCEEGTTKEKKHKGIDIEQIYGHGSQRGSMPGMTVPAVSFLGVIPEFSVEDIHGKFVVKDKKTS